MALRMIATMAGRAGFRSGLGELALQGIETGLEHALADEFAQFALAGRVAVELGGPLAERPITVRDRHEADRREIVGNAHRALEDGVSAAVVVVGQRQQPLADLAAVTGM